MTRQGRDGSVSSGTAQPLPSLQPLLQDPRESLAIHTPPLDLTLSPWGGPTRPELTQGATGVCEELQRRCQGRVSYIPDTMEGPQPVGQP